MRGLLLKWEVERATQKGGISMSGCLPAGTVLLIALPPIAFVVAVIVFYLKTSEED
jgi:hypothetical protein